MTAAVIALVLGFVGVVVLRGVADRVVRGLAPGRAVTLLTAAALAAALTSGVGVSLIGLATLGRTAGLAETGEWSTSALAALLPVPEWLGVTAAVTAIGLLARTGARIIRIAILLWRADQLTRRWGPGRVVIVDDGSADAYTVAGFRGRVVVGRRLLDRLSEVERDLVMRHELSHLTRRHHLYLHAVDIAVAANPLLGPVAQAVRLGVERWADEDAATSVQSRALAARTLARVALVRSELQRSTATLDRPVLPAIGLVLNRRQVAGRVSALLSEPARPLTGRVMLGWLLAVALLLSAATAAFYIHAAFETAEWVWVHTGQR